VLAGGLQDSGKKDLESSGQSVPVCDLYKKDHLCNIDFFQLLYGLLQLHVKERLQFPGKEPAEQHNQNIQV